MEFTADDFEGLAGKLSGLELTSEESAILDGILGRAAALDEEVSGFDIELVPHTIAFKVEISGVSAVRLTEAMGFTKDDSLWQ